MDKNTFVSFIFNEGTVHGLELSRENYGMEQVSMKRWKRFPSSTGRTLVSREIYYGEEG